MLVECNIFCNNRNRYDQKQKPCRHPVSVKSIPIEYTSIDAAGNIYLPAVAIFGTITPPTIKIRPISSVVTKWQNIFCRSRKHADPWPPAESPRKTGLETMFQHLHTYYNIDSMAGLLIEYCSRVSTEAKSETKNLMRWMSVFRNFLRGPPPKIPLLRVCTPMGAPQASARRTGAMRGTPITF